MQNHPSPKISSLTRKSTHPHKKESELLHEFEIAMRLITPCALSHFTAFHIHELTDQLPLKVFISVPTDVPLPALSHGNILKYDNTQYKYIRVRPSHFFGFMHISRGITKITVTDLERTLLDGLIHPQYCGGIREVIHAFTIKEFDAVLLVEYAKKLGNTLCKRLGWVLEHTGYTGILLDVLERIPSKGFIKLNASGIDIGPYNKRWMIRENV